MELEPELEPDKKYGPGSVLKPRLRAVPPPAIKRKRLKNTLKTYGRILRLIKVAVLIGSDGFSHSKTETGSG